MAGLAVLELAQLLADVVRCMGRVFCVLSGFWLRVLCVSRFFSWSFFFG